MANEIILNLYAKLDNSYLKDEFAPGQITVTQTTCGRAGHAQELTISEEVIDFGDVTTPGYCCLRNLDDTWTIEWGPDVTGALAVAGELGPGEVAVFRVGSSTVLRARVAGGTTEDTALLDVHLWQD